MRPSMDKFGSNHPQLEVCCVASWLPSYLNRQVIIMMDFNGVPEEVSSLLSRCSTTARGSKYCQWQTQHHACNDYPQPLPGLRLGNVQINHDKQAMSHTLTVRDLVWLCRRGPSGSIGLRASNISCLQVVSLAVTLALRKPSLSDGPCPMVRPRPAFGPNGLPACLGITSRYEPCRQPARPNTGYAEHHGP